MQGERVGQEAIIVVYMQETATFQVLHSRFCARRRSGAQQPP